MARLNYAPPKKRSVLIAGHQTSISLEPAFWAELEHSAGEDGTSLNGLIARIDAERLGAERPPNLTSALRQFLLLRALQNRGGE
jgi:predicted DNA-binding ribbon-helix-helix protein